MTVSLEKIKKIIAFQLGRLDIEEDKRLVEDYGVESAELVNIIAAVEERFDIEFNEAEIPGIRTVDDLYRAVITITTASLTQ